MTTTDPEVFTGQFAHPYPNAFDALMWKLPITAMTPAWTGSVTTKSAASGTLLLCLASKQAKLGLVFLDMRRAIEDIRKIL